MSHRELSLTYGSALIDSVAAGTGVYTLEASQPTGWITAGDILRVYGCTNAANNGEFTVTSISGTTLTLVNAASVAESSSPGAAGFLVGGTSVRTIHSYIVNTRKHAEATVECTFDVRGTANTEAGFSTAIDDVETAFRTPFQTCIVTQGATDLYTFNQVSNTGLDAQPEITKREEGASGRMRRYTVRLTIGLPANTNAELQSGLREHSVEVSYDAARIRTVTVTGLFTAVGSSNGRAQYDAQIGSLETSVFNALSITAANRELIEEPTADHTYNTKTVSFRRVWRELIFSQAGSGNDNAAIKRQVLSIGRTKEAPGDSLNVKRLATLNVQYDCWLDKDTSTDLRGTWQNTIRPWVVDQVRSTLAGGAVAIIEEEPRFTYDENRISSRMVFRGVLGLLLERSVNIEDEFQTGWTLIPAWTGDPDSKYDFPGPRLRRRTVTDTKKVLGHVYTLPAELHDAGRSTIQAAGLNVFRRPGGLRVRHMSSKPAFIHRRMGLTGASTIDTTDIVKVDVYEFFKPIAATGGGGVATG